MANKEDKKYIFEPVTEPLTPEELLAPPQDDDTVVIAGGLSEDQSMNVIKRDAAILKSLFMPNLHLYFIEPDSDLQGHAIRSYTIGDRIHVFDQTTIVRLSDTSNFLEGRLSKGHFFTAINKVLNDGVERGVKEVAIHGDPELANMAAKRCSELKVAVTNYPENELPYPVQNTPFPGTKKT